MRTNISYELHDLTHLVEEDVRKRFPTGNIKVVWHTYRSPNPGHPDSVYPDSIDFEAEAVVEVDDVD